MSNSALGNPIDKIEEIIKRATNETGDGGDSDAEGTGFEIMNDLMSATRDSEDHKLLNNYDKAEMNVDNVVDNHTMSYASTNNLSLPTVICGAPDGWKPPTTPEDWKPTRQREGNKEPIFQDINNPGKWDSFQSRSTFQGKYNHGDYSHHVMPAGARVLPKDPETGKHTTDGWELHYKGWKDPNSNSAYHRDGASKDNLFPSYRESKLDKDYLKKMGLTDQRMFDGDTLFFAQLILPICDPAMSGINGDPRKAYYLPVKTFTNTYAAEVKKWDVTYGNMFHMCNPEELVRACRDNECRDR